MYRYELKLRVRYAETDKMGIVYHGNYAQYFEVARVEALRALGFSYAKMEEEGVLLPVREHTHRFHKPARYDEELTIKVSVPTLPGTRFTFVYEVVNEQGEIITTGETILVFVSAETMRPMKPPVELIEAIESYYKG